MTRTYGTLSLHRFDGEPMWWELCVEPHVALRLKRVFGRLAKEQKRTLRLSVTPEVSRDLVWFLQRYPLDVDREAGPLLYDLADQHDRTVQSTYEVLTGKAPPRHFELTLPLRSYQSVAAEAAIRRGGLLVADDVGLGKTAIGIAVIASEPAHRPALVVTLTHLCQQWQREFAKFAPGLRTHIAKKGIPYPLTIPVGRKRRGQNSLFHEEPDVIILNYAKLGGWAAALDGKVKTVVFDECQELRRTGTIKYHAGHRVGEGAAIRLGLSATPIYNYGGEFHNVMDCLRPGALGSWGEFTTEWCSSYAEERKASIVNPRAFGTYLRDEGLMLRRTREDVGRELPPVSIVPHHVDADPERLKQSDSAIAELCKLILTSEAGRRGDAMRAAGEFDWRLRAWTGVAKAQYVARFVDLLVESGEQVVLYGWHHAVYDVWDEELRRHDPVFFTGQETTAQKEASRKRFLSGASRVLCMSLRSGAGLDGLQQVCATVVFGELDWSPNVHTQCIGRVNREGQKRPVVAYYLIADEGSDPVIADVLGVKRSQFEPVLDPDAPLVQQISKSDQIRRLAADYASRHGIRLTPALAPRAEEASA